MDRLSERFPLERGSHDSREQGMCAMEMVAWLAGEPHSDEPRCACPVIAAFVRAANDVMGGDERNVHLRPLVPQLVNTRRGFAVQQRRGWLVLDCMLRELVPMWLEQRGRTTAARAFRSLGSVRSAVALERAAGALGEHGVELRAARWVVQRAREGRSPARFVAGAVQIARGIADERAWPAVARTIAAMAAVGRNPHDGRTPEGRPVSSDPAAAGA